MHTYELRFVVPTSEPDTAMPVMIAARSPSDALQQAKLKGGAHQAELWEDGRKLARLRNIGTREDAVWIID